MDAIKDGSTSARTARIRSVALDRQKGRSEEHVTHSAYALLISNISDRDRARDVGHFDGILMTFINDVDQVENRLGKTSKTKKDPRSHETDA